MTQKADKYPDLDTMRAYLEQRLSATDRLAFEEMLASDPDLADDLEELELALQHPEGRERLLAHQKRVALAIQKQAPARSRTLRPGYLAMAASLLLLAAFGFWFFAKKEQPKASDFIAWNEAPAMRGDNDKEVAKALQAGLDGNWQKAADMFQAQDGSYLFSLPASVWQARALFMAGKQEQAISIFSEELNNPDLLPNNQHQIRLYRLAAFLELNKCEEAKADLGVLQMSINKAIGRDLEVLEIIFY